MDPTMDFQVVVLAGGTSDKLSPLVSKELPKALLPVANKPLLSYVLELLEASNLKNIIVVVEGDEAAAYVESWLSVAYMDRLNVEVAKTPADVGTVGAIRVVAPFLTSSDILGWRQDLDIWGQYIHRVTTIDFLERCRGQILSGDLVSDISPGAIAATHRKHGAAVTALFCPAPVSGSSDSSSSGGKDNAKKPSRCNVVGLDPTRQFLLHVVSGAKVEKDIHIQKGLLRAVGQIEIRSDFMDAHVYAFKRTVLMDVLDREDKFHSVKEDVLPYLVRTQLKSKISTRKDSSADESSNGATKELPSEDININSPVPSNQNLRWLSQHRGIAPSSYQEVYISDCDLKSQSAKKTHKCCVYFSGKTQYCARLNSVQAFGDINRDLLGEASHITGYTFSPKNNVVHPTVVQGTKTTTGGQCIIAEGTVLGDKCSVKRSVIGRHCRIGSNVKIVNSIVMNHVTIEDNCTIQGSVISSNVQIQERASLKDCQVGAGYVITAGSEYKSEPLTKR